MHAIVCQQHGGPEVLQYERIADPQPGPEEVLIRAEAIGVNYVDTMRRSGRHPTAPTPPFIPGIEVCGRVAAVGPAVTAFGPGDRVIGRCIAQGAYAELVPVEARFTVLCPGSLSAAEGAALFVNGQTAYHALFTAGRVRSGQTVLVTAAAGGVGACAVQMAHTAGARVIAAASTPEKLALARELGADALVNYALPDWPQQVLEATDGRGADLVLESVGGHVAAGCLRCWATGGRMVIYGKASGQPAAFTGDDLLFGSRTVHGLAVGQMIEDQTLMQQAMDDLADRLQSKSLRLVIGQTYPLHEARQAHQDLENRRTHGKLVLVPGSLPAGSLTRKRSRRTSGSK